MTSPSLGMMDESWRQADSISLQDLEPTKGKLLGKGFFGEVREMRDRRTGAAYALKVVPKQLIQKHHLTSQLMREIQILYGLKHPHIIRLFFHLEDDTNYYLGMEVAAGGGMFDRLKKASKFSPQLAAKYFSQVCEAINYLHKRPQKIIHRDIKPENLLLDEHDSIKLADFGWSNVLRDTQMRQTFCGTLDYLSPEMIKGEGHNESLDCWSLGVLLYEFLVGRSPFGAPSQDEVCRRILHCELRWPHGGTDADGMDLIQRLLKVRPHERLTVDQALRHRFVVKYTRPSSPDAPLTDTTEGNVGGLLAAKVRLEREVERLRQREERYKSEVRKHQHDSEERALEVVQITKRNQQLEADITQLTSDLEESKTALQELTAKLAESDTELQRRQAAADQLPSVQQALDEKERLLVDMEHKKAQLTQKVCVLESEVSGLRTSAHAAEEELHALTDKHRTAMQEKREDAMASECRIHTCETELAVIQSQKEHLEQVLKGNASLAPLLTSHRDDRDKIEKMAADIRAGLDRVAAQQEGYQTRGELQRENERLSQSLLQMKKDMAALQLSAERDKHRAVEQMQALHREELRTVRERMAEAVRQMEHDADQRTQRLSGRIERDTERRADQRVDMDELQRISIEAEALRGERDLLLQRAEHMRKSLNITDESDKHQRSRIYDLETALAQERARRVELSAELGDLERCGLDELKEQVSDPIERETFYRTVEATIRSLLDNRPAPSAAPPAPARRTLLGRNVPPPSRTSGESVPARRRSSGAVLPSSPAHSVGGAKSAD